MNEELVNRAKELDIELNPEWSDQYVKRLITMAEKETEDLHEPEPVAMFPVKLLKNYRPESDNYRVVGDAVQPIYPGAGTGVRLWAGTTVELPRDEAVKLIENKHTNFVQVKHKTGELARDESGNVIRRRIVTNAPIAERADAIPL